MLTVLIGLGNIGKKYQDTRHNFGFMVIDEIVKKYGFNNCSRKFKSELCQGKIADHDIMTLKPQTYMNNSGVAVSLVKKFYKIPVRNIIVFHDDLDLELGRIKIKTGGGNAGHNGLESIDGLIGKNYVRVRLGIEHPQDKDLVKSYVLKKFKKSEQTAVDFIVRSIAEFLPELLTDREKFLNRFYSLA